MTTDTMRQKFERWWSGGNSIRESAAFLDRKGNGYMSASLHNQWMAYQKGQSDLIEAMGEPKAYIYSQNGVVDNVQFEKHEIVEGHSWGFTRMPLYRLPEDAPKPASVLNIKVTGAETGKMYKLAYLQNGHEDQK